MGKINIAVIGLGARGSGNLKTILKFSEIEVTAVCDLYKDRCEKAVQTVRELGFKTPFSTVDYTQIIGRRDVDAFLIFTSWESHIKIAADAMRAGYAVGLEVGGAQNLDECFELVKAQREKNAPFMLLENCCFGKHEMLVRNMAFDGIFGDVVHCHGAYAHDLREEICTGREKRHYRLKHYIENNCENYPTHELGPIAKILNINNGNKMLKLVSVASKAAGLERYIKDRSDSIVNKDLIGQKFRQGDIVNTIITCAGGETISLRLDTSLPRSYSRELTVHGTKALYEENTYTVFMDGDAEDFNTQNFYKCTFGNAERFESKYLPDCWKKVNDAIISSGHGGMDYFTFEAFFNALLNGEAMPIDVYDAASWMAVSCLSKKSILAGGMSIDIPDFKM